LVADDAVGARADPSVPVPGVRRAGGLICGLVAELAVAGPAEVAAATFAARVRTGATKRARSCEVSIGPAAVTSCRRRTGTAVETIRSVIRPGVQLFSSGTFSTARGSPRAPRAWAVTRPASVE
jgi:hypothetical protein